MHQKLLLVLVLFFSKQLLFSQTYEFKKKFSKEERGAFLGMTKKIFSINNQISYNLSSKDAEISFSDMNDEIQYNDDYLKELKTKLSKDSLNAITLNNLGNYYTNKGNKPLAKKYFKKSLDNLSLQTFVKKDSAQYYSFRGILKSNLETSGAITDIEKALRINPNDSISILFYPMFLIQQNRFSESKKICIDALDKKNESPTMPYTFLCMSILFENVSTILDPSKKEASRNKNYDELVDYSLIYQYADKYKSSIQVQNLKKMSEILGLFIRMYQFDLNEDNEILLNFSSREITKINTLEKEFKELLAKGKINPFTANKSLCTLHFMLGNKDKAIEYGKKAIALFPESKKNIQFNPYETYDLLLSLYQLKKDQVNFKKTLAEKIQKSSQEEKKINDYLSMAYSYLYENDFVQSEEWCKKAREIDSDNFEALSLLSHLKFMSNPNSLENSLGQFYMEQASRQVKVDFDNYTLGLQAAIYMILYGNPNDAKLAYDNIQNSRKLTQKECKICDELIGRYITVRP